MDLVKILLSFVLLALFVRVEASVTPISSNPGAVNLLTGTGDLGRVFGLPPESGARLGGLWILDYNYLFTGGIRPGRGSGNQLFQLSLSLDTEKLSLWKGGLFGVDFLQFNGSLTNGDAGSIQGYNNLPGLPPLNRTELYQLWYQQTFFDEKVLIRIGKQVPTIDFNNVVKPLPMIEEDKVVPDITGLIYNPVFVNPTMLGFLPGSYDSACGVVLHLFPNKHLYFTYGVYDGNLARAVPIGLRGPEFNGYYFHIAEAGWWWKIRDLPGNIGVGGWAQSGKLIIPFTDISEEGAEGLYLFGTQRLSRCRSDDPSGVIAFWQYGINNSKTIFINQYWGGGVTFLGLLPCRPYDSLGLGVAWSQLNPNRFERSNECMLQAYCQNHLFKTVFFLTALTYIPNPGANPSQPHAWAATCRIISLF